MLTKNRNAYKMSIFISIASYQDPLLVSTIFGAYNNAQDKDDLIFSICDQSDNAINLDEVEFQIKLDMSMSILFFKRPLLGKTQGSKFLSKRGLFLTN